MVLSIPWSEVGHDTAIVLMVLCLILLLLLLWSIRSSKRRSGSAGRQSMEEEGSADDTGDGKGGGDESSIESDPQAEQEATRRRQAEAQRRRAERLRLQKKANQLSGLMKDPVVAQSILDQTGQGHLPLQQLLNDREAVERLAKSVPDDLMKTMDIAVNQQDILLDLAKEEERHEVSYPTSDIESETMTNPDQFPSLLPEQLMMDDDQFYGQLAQDQLQILQPYEQTTTKKRAFLLVDVSPSMGEAMKGGIPRNVWARGIAVSQLLRAVRGEADYCIRMFDGNPYQLRCAASPAEASKLVTEISGNSFTGSDTNIYRALKQAVSDINANQTAVPMTDVLLITDGEDPSMDDTAKVKRLLGDNVHLHVAVLGTDSKAMQQVATTYHHFD